MSDALANQGCGRANAHQDKIMTFARRRNAPLCLKHITIISRSKIVVFQCDNFFFPEMDDPWYLPKCWNFDRESDCVSLRVWSKAVKDGLEISRPRRQRQRPKIQTNSKKV